MKIATWNVNGIRARQAQLLEWLARERPDVVCLQEIKASLDQLPFELREHRRATGCTGTAAGYSGVALLVAKDAFRRAAGVRASRRSTSRPRDPAEVDRRRLVVRRSTCPTAARTSGEAAVPRGARRVGGRAAGGRTALVCAATSTSRAPSATSTRRSASRTRSGARPEERALSSGSSSRGLVDVGRKLESGQRDCSPGGRRGATCSSATSAGGSTTCSPTAALARHEPSTCAVQREIGTSDHGPVVATFG